MHSITFILFFIVGVNVNYGAKFPEDIKKCKHGDSECLKNIINFIFENKNYGIPAMNLMAINPIKINSINIKQGKESPVNIDLNFRDTELFGIDTARVYEVKGFGENMNTVHEIKIKAAAVSLIGKYDTKGRVLLLPIYGSGDSNITLLNPDMRVKFMGKEMDKNGKKYMSIEKFKLTFTISRMYINMENLFNGDKTLSDNTNIFLNENWEDIFNELKGAIFQAFGLIFENIISNVFNKFPYNELFAE